MPTTNLPVSFPTRTITSSRCQGGPTREAPAHLIRALRQGAGTGLLAFLLGSKKRQHFLGCVGASIFSMPTPKMLSGSSMEMLSIEEGMSIKSVKIV
jgi:hypothetical protein